LFEASTIHDSQNLRNGKLEESMETLSSIFSSLKIKKEKAFVGKEQKNLVCFQGVRVCAKTAECF
jgi:hypothetical protein